MMINRKDTPAPFVQRAEPPPLPQTPQNKSKTKRASNGQRPPGRETYAGGNARGTADEVPRDERISHDLLLTDNTRHSIVDNMLMSLNPDQPKTFPSPQDRPNFSAGSDATGSPRHLHSSSTTSEGYNFSDDSHDRRSSQFGGRGRRSNSSSNFQSALGRIDSVHDSDLPDVQRGKRFQVKRAGTFGGTARGHTRQSSSKGSSGSTYLDYGQMASQLKAPGPLGRRSTSFDHSFGRGGLHSASSSGTHPPMPGSLSQPILYDDFEAAPTPTVPGGPRRDESPGFPSQGPIVPQAQRRNSIKSSKSYGGRKTKGENLQWDNPMPPKNGFSSRRGSKQIPSYLRSRNASPVRQVSEPILSKRLESNDSRLDSNGSRFEINPQPRETPVQRPGFFRRVFGSSKGLTPSASDVQLQSTQAQSSQPRANSRNGVAEPNRLHKTPAIEDLSNPPKPAPPPLQKKPSSFFRRRKKSISENIPPPTLPVHLQQNATAMQVEESQRSPVSSLRKVMNPYLDDTGEVAPTLIPGGNHPASSHTSRLHSQRSFEPTFPAQNASIDPEIRPSQPRDLPDTFLGAPSPHVYNSFLNDDSSVENRTPTDATDITSSAALEAATRNRGLASIPLTPQQSVAKDAVSASSKLPDPPGSANRSLNEHPLSAPTLELSTMKVLTPAKKPASSQGSVSADDRVWLRPGDSDEETPRKEPKLSTEEAEKSPISDYHSASSTMHPLKRGDEIRFPETTAGEPAPNLTPAPNLSLEKELTVEMDSDEPTAGERLMAKRLFEGDESIATQETAAAWLGDPSIARGRIRKAYIEMFQFKDLTILAALRGLCGKLYLKGEAQQVDRILDAFSNWWSACNPNNGFKATDVIHTICYSLLMLNTDLHQAEIETKMTRTQFLKNILPTIRRVVTDAAPDAFTNARASTMPPARPWMNDQPASGNRSSPSSPSLEGPRRSYEGQRPVHRLSHRPSDQAAVAISQLSTPVDFASSTGDCGPLVKTGFHGKLSTWENQIELILKDFYNSVRQQSLPLYQNGAPERPAPHAPQQSSNSLAVMTSNILRRTPSMVSKTGSENMNYNRGRQNESRLGTGRWTSKTRSRPRLYPASTVASSRRSSFDEQSSVTSPSVTSAWSKFSSFGRTQTSFSVDSLGSHFPPADFQQSIGFANALSQAIIREEHPTAGDEESLRAAPLLEDESLELAGAPWAKEGILKHKHHLEAIDKRAKDRNWVESFAVIEKGHMKLFSFNMNAKSLRLKNKSKQTGGAVGGGNWMENAETLGSFVLRQTIASALPPPGYSKTRPHVWALSLPTGAVHLFQVGTPEIVKEFVTTANYWSARLSKEPLVGGISNIEYGWGEGVINTALLSSNHSENTPLMPSNMSSNSVTRPSLQSSIRSTRSSVDQNRGFGPKLPGDKVTINDWMPPQQSMVASALMEVDQLKQLISYVRNIEEELQRHNELRGPMLLAFSPRHPNHSKAMTNWERKSSYLLREIVKFRTYIDCLQAAHALREQIYAERAAALKATEPAESNQPVPVDA